MTKVKLFPNGFSVKGHCSANVNDEAGRLVCAAVSSAVYLTANTITEVVGDKADITEKDGEMTVRVSSVSEHTKTVLQGFKIHILQLSEQYPNCIKVNSEV
ncbi:MAG: ribosomal-processing cysteine protease Prp [Clostridia bacterium]|nr:ribosomal-processing cysteine protease Prp [Clostridia bacterium]